MQRSLSKIKQHPILTICTLFTLLSSLFWLSFGVRAVWLAMWIIVPIVLSTDKAFSCLVYMSLYARVAVYRELFSILICVSFMLVLIKEILYLNKNKLII